MSEYIAQRLNRDLLKTIREEIASNPKNFVYEYYFTYPQGEDEIPESVGLPAVRSYTDDWLVHKCGTAACIAGWAVLLSTEKIVRSIVSGVEAHICSTLTLARTALNIDMSDREKLYFDEQGGLDSFLFVPWEFNSDQSKGRARDYTVEDALNRIDYVLAAPTDLTNEQLSDYLQAYESVED